MTNTFKEYKNISTFLEMYPNTPEVVLELLEHSIDSPEHPVYHPELFLIKHIEIVVGRCLEIEGDKELHFAGLFHDITKHGFVPNKTYQVGEMKHLPEGSYWQNIFHPEQAVDLLKSDKSVKDWLKEHSVNVEKVVVLVANHMKMKNYFRGKQGGKGGLKESKRTIFQESLKDVWKELHYFSAYCDSMGATSYDKEY